MSVMRWGARLAPVLIIAVVGYVVYAVIVSLVCEYRCDLLCVMWCSDLYRRQLSLLSLGQV